MRSNPHIYLTSQILGIRILQKQRGMSVPGGRNAKLSADENNYNGQTRISFYVSPLSESPCKLLNRVVSNGTLRWCYSEFGITEPYVRVLYTLYNLLIYYIEKLRYIKSEYRICFMEAANLEVEELLNGSY